jgi:hypothetical protein
LAVRNPKGNFGGLAGRLAFYTAARRLALAVPEVTVGAIIGRVESIGDLRCGFAARADQAHGEDCIEAGGREDEIAVHRGRANEALEQREREAVFGLDNGGLPRRRLTRRCVLCVGDGERCAEDEEADCDSARFHGTLLFAGVK